MTRVPAISLDPPGTIGFTRHDDGCIVLLRFDEATDDVMPSDAMGALKDFAVHASTTMPSVVAGYTGPAREFVAADLTGLITSDVESGASLLTRNMTIRAIVRWDIALQNTYGSPGAVLWRGANTNAADRTAYAMELAVVDSGQYLGELRMAWQDIAGTLHVAAGAQFQMESPSQWLMLTITRRWVSTSEVVVRYYVGDKFIGETTETAGDIGGGTTGSTTLGARKNNAAWERFLCGAIDEVQVLEGVMSDEEIEHTYERITKWQPLGLQLYMDSLPPGWPLNMSADTRVGKEARLTGHGLGYAAAGIENIRKNLMPDRAYGRALARWERMTRKTPRASDTVQQRRDRVVAHFRQRAGVSPPGVRIVLHDLLAVDSVDDIAVFACSNTRREDFASALDLNVWRESEGGIWATGGGSLNAIGNVGDSADFLAGTFKHLLTGADGPPRLGVSYGHQVFAKLTPTTLPNNSEMGLIFWDWPRGNAMLFGIRRNAGAYQVVSQRYLANVAQAAVVHATTSLTPHWLHMRQDVALWNGTDAIDSLQNHTVRWSTTGPSSGFSEATGIQAALGAGWIGTYIRAWTGTTFGGAVSVSFDDLALRCPHGRAPFHFYAYRDGADPGEYDLAASNAVLRTLKQSHTHAGALASLSFIAGDDDSVCGVGPCGVVG